MDKITNDIQLRITDEYDKFSFVRGNRDINPVHLERLRKSMEREYLVSIILVNEHREIIDGQHRFMICKENGWPFHYIILQDYGLKEVHIYNQHSSDWTMTQFMESYAKMELKEYKIYKFFKEKYNFPHDSTLPILLGIYGNPGSFNREKFKDGLFKVKDFTRATKIADMIYSFSKYYEGFRRHTFIMAFLYILNITIRQEMVMLDSYNSHSNFAGISWNFDMRDWPKCSDLLEVEIWDHQDGITSPTQEARGKINRSDTGRKEDSL